MNCDNCGEIKLHHWRYSDGWWFTVGWETNEGEEREKKFRALDKALTLVTHLFAWRLEVRGG